MKSWRERKGLYQITEIGKGKSETFHMIGTADEISYKLKGLNDMNGYIPGLGGDKNYSAIAVLERYVD